MKVKGGLGKGLDALFPTVDSDQIKNLEFRLIAVNEIEGNKNQPRKSFDDEKIAELSESIKQHGLLQPLILRKVNDHYEIIVGERRWRAALKAGLQEVPAVIRHVDDIAALEYGLVENLHRQDLNPLEESLAYKMLLEMSGLTQDELAQKIGKDRSTVSNMLRLLGLPAEVKKYLGDGLISVGHAKALLSVEDATNQLRICQVILDQKLSVRQTEDLIRKLHQPRISKPSQLKLDPNVQRIQDNLTTNFGTRVRIVPGKKVGKIVFEYYSNEDLQRIIEMLGA